MPIRAPPFSAVHHDGFWYPYDHPALIPISTCSSIDSDATASNLPGAGRTLGLLLSALGNRLEMFLNKRAARLSLGPEGVVQEIRQLRRHDETSIIERHASPVELCEKLERKALRRLCKKLFKYANLMF